MKPITSALAFAACFVASPVLAPSGQARAGTLTTIYTFKGSSDATSQADLISHKNLLYGASHAGGLYCYKQGGCGTIFSVDPKTGTEAVLYSFGMTHAHNGPNPEGHLVYADGALYGITTQGGDGGPNGCDCGTVFRFDLKTGKYKGIHNFKGGSADGSSPAGPLIVVNNILYGTTIGGGPYANKNNQGGGVYQIDLATGALSFLYFFHQAPDGFAPYGGVIYENGLLYGTTSQGGGTDCECGTLFSVDPKTGVESLLHSFGTGTDGQTPYAGLTYGKGIIYGTTIYGGTDNCFNVTATGCGTLFSYDPGTSTEKVLYDFTPNGTDNTNMLTRPIYEDNAVYGSVQAASGSAMIYKYNLANAKYSVVVTFPAVSSTTDLTFFQRAFYGCASVGSGGEVFKATR